MDSSSGIQKIGFKGVQSYYETIQYIPNHWYIFLSKPGSLRVFYPIILNMIQIPQGTPVTLETLTTKSDVFISDDPKLEIAIMEIKFELDRVRKEFMYWLHLGQIRFIQLNGEIFIETTQLNLKRIDLNTLSSVFQSWFQITYSNNSFIITLPSFIRFKDIHSYDENLQASFNGMYRVVSHGIGNFIIYSEDKTPFYFDVSLLISSCGYFEKFFTSDPLNQKCSVQSSFSTSTLKYFQSYIYYQRVAVPQGYLIELFKLSSYYSVPELTKTLTDYTLKNLFSFKNPGDLLEQIIYHSYPEYVFKTINHLIQTQQILDLGAIGQLNDTSTNWIYQIKWPIRVRFTYNPKNYFLLTQRSVEQLNHFERQILQIMFHPATLAQLNQELTIMGKEKIAQKVKQGLNYVITQCFIIQITEENIFETKYSVNQWDQKPLDLKTIKGWITKHPIPLFKLKDIVIDDYLGHMKN